MSTPTPTTGDTNTTTANTSQTPLEVLQQIDFMPHVQALVNKLVSGQISVKDADNESGAVKVRIAKAKAALAEMDGLHETIHCRQAKIVSLDKQIQKKLELLQSFKQMAEAEGFDLGPAGVDEVRKEVAGILKTGVPENAIEDVEMS